MPRATSAGRWPPSVSVSIAMAIRTGYAPARVRRCILGDVFFADWGDGSRPDERLYMPSAVLLTPG